ncbi:MAG: 3-keto-disaccharide hydrolase [Steroidobacterales bacterium]
MSRLIFAFISLAATALLGCTGMSPASYETGWTTLLDGPRGFDENWTRMGAANWRIVDGVAQADTGKKGDNSFLMTRKAYGDFMLRAEFWVSDDANSGIYLRCPDLANVTDRNCTEANVFDQRPDPTYGTGAITHLSPIKDMPKAGGRWNAFEITAQGPRIVVVLNGVKTAETDKAHALRGNIGLQWAQGVVKFRKVEIKPL